MDKNKIAVDVFDKLAKGYQDKFMHYYEADYMVNVLKENCFKILHLERKNYLAQDNSNTTYLILIAQYSLG